jgi:hypothetical protein
MTANYGGTELPAALNFVFRYRNMNKSTMVFVLTDGEVCPTSGSFFFYRILIYKAKVNMVDEVISIVGRAVASSNSDAPLRVFSMGIGETVSTAIVEGIARVGNGKSLFIVNNDSLADKLAMLFRAVSPCIKNVTINWGTPGNSQSPTDPSYSVQLSDSISVRLPSVRQSPTQVPDIYPGVRFTVFALMMHSSIPKQIMLRGKHSDRDEQIMFVVPVSSVKIFGAKNLIPLHILSARHLIDDLIEDRATLPETITRANDKDVRRAAVVHLGEQYQLASRYTSFVAVYDEMKILPPLSSTNDEEPIEDDDSSSTSSIVRSITPEQNLSESQLSHPAGSLAPGYEAADNSASLSPEELLDGEPLEENITDSAYAAPISQSPYQEEGEVDWSQMQHWEHMGIQRQEDQTALPMNRVGADDVVGQYSVSGGYVGLSQANTHEELFDSDGNSGISFVMAPITREQNQSTLQVSIQAGYSPPDNDAALHANSASEWQEVLKQVETRQQEEKRQKEEEPRQEDKTWQQREPEERLDSEQLGKKNKETRKREKKKEDAEQYERIMPFASENWQGNLKDLKQIKTGRQELEAEKRQEGRRQQQQQMGPIPSKFGKPIGAASSRDESHESSCCQCVIM